MSQCTVRSMVKFIGICRNGRKGKMNEELTHVEKLNAFYLISFGG